MIQHVCSWGRYLRALAVIALLVASVGTRPGTGRAAGVTRYVAPGGSDASPCTQGAPCATFAHTIAVAQTGDTVSAAAGTYAEGNIVVAKDLTIAGAGAGQTIISVGGSAAAPRRGLFLGDPAGAPRSITVGGLTVAGGYVAASTPAAIGGGAGIIIGFAAVVVLNNVDVANNQDASGVGGGGIYNFSGTLTLNGCSVRNNIATQGGGIAHQSPNAMTINNSTISGNQIAGVGDGGGIINLGKHLTVAGSVITGNTGARFGGGIANITNSDITIAGSAVTGNVATDTGGGIFNDGDNGGTLPTSMTIGQTTVSGNKVTKANSGGGGITNLATLTLSNSTLSSNTLAAASQGGGLYNQGGATATLAYATIAANTAASAGGISNGGVVNALGVLLAGNAGGNCGGTALASTGFDLSGDTTCAGIPNAALTLGALGDNGGPTQTQALPAGSPAIDAGGSGANGCPPTDQRGVARPQGAACDIGAYERAPSGPPSVSAAPVQVPFGQNSTTLTFATGDGSSGTLCVAGNGGPAAPFAGGPSGTATAAFINSGSYLFALHAGGTCAGATLATTTVTKLNPKGTTGPAILAAPTTLSFATSVTSGSGLVRSSTIAFDTGDGTVGQVMLSVNGSTPVLFTASQFGSVTAPWLFSGTYAFTLVKGGVIVDTATVKTTAQISTPNGTTAGGPSPNVTTTVGHPVALTFDTGSGQAAALCTQFGGLVSFSQNGAGNATSVDTAGAVVYSLHVGSCAGALATPGTVTVTAS